MIKRFFRDSAIYFIPNLISRGLSFFLVPFYTRILAPSDYGAIDLIAIFGNLVSLVIPLEISQGMARCFADAETKEEKKKYSSTSWVFTIFTFTLFLLISFLLSNHLVGVVLGEKKYETIFKMSLFFIFFNGLFYLIQNQLRWELRSQDFAIVSVFFTLTNIFGAVFFALYKQMGLFGIILAQIISGASSCIFGWYLVRKSFSFTLDISALKKMLRFSFPLVPSSIAVFVFTYVDRLMINSLLGIDEVGFYGIASRLCTLITLAISGFQIALTPLIYAHYRDSSTPYKLANIFRYFVSFSLLILLILCLYSKEILMILTTPVYYSAANLVPYLAPGVLLTNMYIFAPGISIKKKTHLILFINIGAGILNVVLNYILIQSIGLIGAAVATFATGFCLFTANMMISQRLYYVPHNWLKIFLAVILGILFYLWGINLSLDLALSVIVKAFIVITFLIMFIFLGLIRPQEITHVYCSIIKRRTLTNK